MLLRAIGCILGNGWCAIVLSGNVPHVGRRLLTSLLSREYERNRRPAGPEDIAVAARFLVGGEEAPAVISEALRFDGDRSQDGRLGTSCAEVLAIKLR